VRTIHISLQVGSASNDSVDFALPKATLLGVLLLMMHSETTPGAGFAILELLLGSSDNALHTLDQDTAIIAGAQLDMGSSNSVSQFIPFVGPLFARDPLITVAPPLKLRAQLRSSAFAGVGPPTAYADAILYFE